MSDNNCYNDSIKWTISIGINSGYDLTNQVRIPEEEVIVRYRKVAEQIEHDTGIYITATIIPSTTIYKEEWGCPKEGEYTYTLSGSCNPFFSDVEKYNDALINLTKELRQEFKQQTVLLEVIPSKVLYDKEEM